MKSDLKRSLAVKAIIRSVPAALSGSFIFVLGEIAIYLIRNGLFASMNIWFWPVIVFLLIGAMIISVPISLAGGMLLAFTLYNESKKKELSVSDAFFRGVRLGVLVSFGLFIALIITYFPRGDWRILLFQGGLGTIILSLMAGWVAVQLKKDISKIV